MSSVIVQNATTGKELVWRRIKITKSLDDICHTLEAELAPTERILVHKHDKIEVRFQNQYVTDSREEGGRRVTTVLVDEVMPDVDESRHSVSVIGRSPARDIIDSSWTGMLTNMTLREITRAIGGKFGINCHTFPTNKPDPTEKVLLFLWKDESPWTKLIEEADNQGYILTSNEAGNLYLWKVASSNRSEGFNLTEGANVKTIRWAENGAEQYHEYIVSCAFIDPPIKVIDNTCKTNRVLTINLTNPGIDERKIRRRAETEMRRRKADKLLTTVSGWGLTDEQIKRLGTTAEKEIFWIPNALIPVKIPSLGLNRSLLISEVEYEASPDTMMTTLTLVNREAYL
jgi:prophage tail gpP-like protein